MAQKDRFYSPEIVRGSTVAACKKPVQSFLSADFPMFVPSLSWKNDHC
jgi:hypothetical protein